MSSLAIYVPCFLLSVTTDVEKFVNKLIIISNSWFRSGHKV